MLWVEKLELTPLSGAKAGPNRASIDSSEKRIMLDYQHWQFYFSQGRIGLSLKIPSQYEKYTSGYT